MENMAVAYKGKPYKYILTLLNVFSRFQWLYPLESKHSSGVKKTVKKIYSVHDLPQKLKSDNGGEFKKHVKEFCTTHKLKMVRYVGNTTLSNKVKENRSTVLCGKKSITIW